MSAADALCELLQRRIGLDPASIGPAVIDRVLQLQVRAGGGDADAYLARLRQDEREFQRVVDAIVVPETWFFRYPESIAAMTSVALRRLAAQPGTPLRILSLPCSTGEEPYTIAIALLDAGVAPTRFHIDAVDISARNLAAAQDARYGRNSFRGQDLRFRDRHFTRDGDTFRLAPAVRERVRFQLGNLLNPALALAGNYDLVFCRNLLIYFDAETQMRSIGILTGLARHDGVLFVGPAEASVLTRLRHPSIGVSMAFAFHATRVTAPAAPPLGAPGQARPPAALAYRPLPPLTPMTPAMPAISMPMTPRPAAPALASAAPDTSAAASLARIGALADQGRVDDGLRACSTHLSRFGPSAAAFYLQGLFHDAARRPVEAKEAYRKTLYLEPRHPQAVLQLAALLDAEGDATGATRLRQRISRGTA